MVGEVRGNACPDVTLWLEELGSVNQSLCGWEWSGSPGPDQGAWWACVQTLLDEQTICVNFEL